MTITYQLSESDYLLYQLYVASKSERIKKKRFRSRIITPIIYIMFAFLFYSQDSFVLMVLFFLIAVLWFFIYPVWEKNHYIKHYKSFIKENYQGRLEKEVTLNVNFDEISAKDESSESIIKTTEIEQIVEILKVIFIRIKSGQSLILPKDKIHNIHLTQTLKEIANHLKIEYKTDLNWQWK